MAEGLAEKKVKAYLNKIRKDNKKINAFLHLNENAVSEARILDAKAKKGRLYGYVFGIKSNINVNGMITNCASKTLENYRAAYDATVISKIKSEDGLILGMLNMDEFAAGISGESSAFGACQNPAAPGRIPGGSSSGSAAAVAAGMCDVTLGSDTGGSIRNPSSNCGVVGIKPSYGLVSRYGLIDLSMSLDQIGAIAKNVSDCALVLDVIKGKDERDAISVESEKIKLQKPGKVKIGIIKLNGVDKKIQGLIDNKIREIEKKLGWQAKDIEIKHIDLAVETYYPLVYSEFFSSTRRFDGRKYGFKIENVSGKEVLRRIFGGSEITKAEFEGAYYEKALKVKEIIKDQFESVFKEVDCVILPVCPAIPWKVGEKDRKTLEEIYAADALTIPANLAEICAISMPAGKIDGIPTGLQIMAGKGKESLMLSIANEIEKMERFKY